MSLAKRRRPKDTQKRRDYLPFGPITADTKGSIVVEGGRFYRRRWGIRLVGPP